MQLQESSRKQCSLYDAVSLSYVFICIYVFVVIARKLKRWKLIFVCAEV